MRKYAYENGLNDSDLDDELRATIAALVEKLKIKLSALERVSCSVRHSGDRTRLEVTREEFEELSQDLVHQTIDYVHKLLSDANLKASDVDTVLLVGGSTRMPMIRNAGALPKESVCRSQSFDGTVGKRISPALSLCEHPRGNEERLRDQEQEEVLRQNRNRRL